MLGTGIAQAIFTSASLSSIGVAVVVATGLLFALPSAALPRFMAKGRKSALSCFCCKNSSAARPQEDPDTPTAASRTEPLMTGDTRENYAGCDEQSDANGYDAARVPAVMSPLSPEDTCGADAALPPAEVGVHPLSLMEVRNSSTGIVSPPPTRVSDELWTAIEAAVIPMHLHGRRWDQIFATDLHGFSYEGLRRRCDNQRMELPPGAEPSTLVLIWAARDVLLGAFVNQIPEWYTKGQRVHIGTMGTVVFSCDANTGENVTLHPALDEADGGNRRFMRADASALTFGGGGGGAAIRLLSSLTKVQTYPKSATFKNLTEALLADALANNVVGVSRDLDAIAAPVGHIEVLVVTERTA